MSKIIKKLNPRRFNGKRHSNETKKKMSKTRKIICKNHPSWVNGKRVDIRGYVFVKDENEKIVVEHRHVYEKFYKLKIPKNMEIHHRDKNKSNNDINNLKMVTRAEHNLIEPRYKKRRHLMAKYKRTDLDTFGASVIKHLKTLDPELTRQDLQHVVGRLYAKLLKENKLDDNLKTHEKVK